MQHDHTRTTTPTGGLGYISAHFLLPSSILPRSTPSLPPLPQTARPQRRHTSSIFSSSFIPHSDWHRPAPPPSPPLQQQHQRQQPHAPDYGASELGGDARIHRRSVSTLFYTPPGGFLASSADTTAERAPPVPPPTDARAHSPFTCLEPLPAIPPSSGAMSLFAPIAQSLRARFSPSNRRRPAKATAIPTAPSAAAGGALAASSTTMASQPPPPPPTAPRDPLARPSSAVFFRSIDAPSATEDVARLTDDLITGRAPHAPATPSTAGASGTRDTIAAELSAMLTGALPRGRRFRSASSVGLHGTLPPPPADFLFPSGYHRPSSARDPGTPPTSGVLHRTTSEDEGATPVGDISSSPPGSLFVHRSLPFAVPTTTTPPLLADDSHAGAAGPAPIAPTTPAPQTMSPPIQPTTAPPGSDSAAAAGGHTETEVREREGGRGFRESATPYIEEGADDGVCRFSWLWPSASPVLLATRPPTQPEV